MLDALGRARDAIHADCRQDDPQCACVAGCDERIGCTCFTTLCLQCHMNWLRGRDPDHLDSDVACGPLE
jgi:hypothetical protein